VATIYIRANELATTATRPGKLPVCKNTLWNWVRKGIFPAPVKLSRGVSAWKLEDVEAWLAAREAA